MKAGKLFGSIRLKIAAAFSLVFMLIATATSLILFQYLKDNLLQARWEFMFSQAEIIAKEVDTDTLRSPALDRDEMIRISYESINGGYVIFRSGTFPQSLIEELKNITVNHLGEAELGLKKNARFDSLDIVLVDEPLFDAENGFFRVVLAKDNKALKAQVKRIRSYLIWANLLSIIISTLLAYLVSGYSLKPIQRIISKARTIEAGESMERIPVQVMKDEVGQLSDTINGMIERIEESIKHQNQFFAMAAHELRTPLANMQSELDYELTKAQSQTEVKTLKSLLEEVVRLKNIVQDFLMLSQLKSKNLELRLTDFPLDELIYESLERMNPALADAHVEVKLSIDEVADLNIRADREKLEAVFINLFDNALRHGAHTEPIQVEIGASLESLEVVIKNSLDWEKRNKLEGMGLGLQIVSLIMAKHGFEIVKDKSQDIFTIKLVLHR